MGSSCENPRLVTESQPPAQQTAPVRVAVVVVVDNAREAQRHVSKKGCVLHNVGISCEDNAERGELIRFVLKQIERSKVDQ